MNHLNFPVETSDAVPENTLYFIPMDVRQAMSIACEACVLYETGRLSFDSFCQVWQATNNIIEKAARENRLGVITGLPPET